MPTPTDHLKPQDQSCERRFYPRIAPRVSSQFDLIPGQPSDILNLSENGVLVASAANVGVNTIHRVALSLEGAPTPIPVLVRVIWTVPDESRLGLQFLNLEENDRGFLRGWAARQAKAAEMKAASSQSAAIAVLPRLAYTSQSSSPHNAEGVAGRPVQPLTLTILPHAPIPIRYFWRSALCTILVGAVWAGIESFLPDKTLKPKSVAAHRVPHRKPDSASPVASPPSNAASPSTDAGNVAIANPGASTSSDISATPNNLPSATLGADGTGTRNAIPPPTRPSAVWKQPVNVAKAPPKPATNVAAMAVPRASASRTGVRTAPTVAANTGTPPPTAPAKAPTPTIETTTAAAVSAEDSSLTLLTPVYTPQILVVPSLSSSAYVKLPGERVLRGHSVTMHVQRSVWVKSGHWPLWPTSSRKKMRLGELVERVDPRCERPAGDSGSVVVLVAIAKNGQISGVRALSGSPQMIPGVLQAVREWRYLPTYLDEKPVETLARVEVNFHAPDATQRAAIP